MTKTKQIQILRAAKERALALWPDRYCVLKSMPDCWVGWYFEWPGRRIHFSADWVDGSSAAQVAAVFDNSIYFIKHGHAPWEVGK